MGEIELTPLDNAIDSIGRVEAALSGEGKGVEPLKAALAWGWHAAGLVAYLRLISNRDALDEWLGRHLEEGEAGVAVDRDAHWDEHERLSFLEILDLFSEVDLPILKPEFYQGWQDRTTRCRELRRKVTELTGRGITAEARSQLLILLALYHRLIRLPGRVRVDTDAARGALPALLDLIELLSGPDAERNSGLQSALDRVRRVL